MISHPVSFIHPGPIHSGYISAKCAAQKAMEKTPCRIVYGCSLILYDKVVTSAANYSLACSDECHRKKNNIPHGKNYEECFSVHAEQAVLIESHSTRGADLVLYGFDRVENREIAAYPCKICAKMIMHAGIRNIYNLRGEHGATALCQKIIAD